LKEYERHHDDKHHDGNTLSPRIITNLTRAINYSWVDQVYRDFMIGVIRILEPRAEKSGAAIYNALQTTDEMYFIMKGAVDVGFELNKKIKYCLRLKKGNVIGAFNCTFEQKTLYSYIT